tara:strand:+ start:54 stop:479 length:426 start_codon:yes stop_codon:yes gene_type:complete
MIKYQLNCKNCNNTFSSWFASSKEYEKLKKLNMINCNLCNSLNIDKSIMSPRILSTSKFKNNIESQKMYEVKHKIKEFQRYIKKNFEYVGEEFAYEARSIHYGNKQKKKGIYGKASLGEIKELKEEGIETVQVPWIDKSEN